MNTNCTTLEQSKQLIELGIDVDTSDMVYLKSYFEEEGEYNLLVGSYHEGYMEKDDGTLVPVFDEHIPAWSLNGLMDILTKQDYTIKCINNQFNIDIPSRHCKIWFPSLLDAAFEMVVYLLEQNKI